MRSDAIAKPKWSADEVRLRKPGTGFIVSRETLRLDAGSYPRHNRGVKLSQELEQRLAEQEAAGLRRRLECFVGVGAHVRDADGQLLLNFASNDYLGLAARPFDQGEPEAVGASASRLVTGTLRVHEQLEAELAAYVGLPSSLVFSSGYAANVGTIPALVGPGDVIFSDERNHASLIDGCRLSKATIVRFRHNDLHHLSALLKDNRGRGKRALILSEAVFSMDGDSPPLAAMRTLADQYDAWLYVDEAHSLGVLGESGAGLCVAERVQPDILIGTLGKSIGTQGAFVAGGWPLRDWLVQRARSFVFSTGISPLLVQATRQNLQHVKAANQARQRALDLCAQLRMGLGGAISPSQKDGALITSLILGDPAQATRLEARLRMRGILVRAIRPPTVPPGTSRLRIVVTSDHTSHDIDQLLHAIRDER